MGDRALQLLSHNARTSKFELGEEALEKLRQIRGPVAVVAVCGRARQGKSFLLNQLLGRSKGFQVGPTQRPCTKGLWMWSEPIPMTSPDGSKFHVCLLDCEGIDAYDQTGSYSVQIFSLAVLCSSLFVYNQMGGIDEAALERLQLIVEMTKHIRVRTDARDRGSAPTQASELAGYTPTFFWLLRDFYLNLSDASGRAITPDDYLEAALASVPGSSESIKSKNQIRDSIKKLFPDRKCFALMRPADEEKTLQNLDSVPLDQLRPQFLTGLRRLTNQVFESARPKEVGGSVITGAALCGMLKSYVDAINNGAVPTIATAWQSVVEAECGKAAEAALAAYEEAFDQQGTEADEDQLRAAHAKAVAAAQAVFSSLAFGDGPARQAFERKVQERLQARFKQICHAKYTQAQAVVTSALDAAAEQLEAMVERPRDPGTTFEVEEAGSVEEMVQEMNRLIEVIGESNTGGPFRYKSLVEFFKARMGPLFIKAARRERAAHAATLEEVEARVRAEADVAMREELARVFQEAETSATTAAEEAYLSMLEEFSEKMSSSSPLGQLPAPPSQRPAPLPTPPTLLQPAPSGATSLYSLKLLPPTARSLSASLDQHGPLSSRSYGAEDAKESSVGTGFGLHAVQPREPLSSNRYDDFKTPNWEVTSARRHIDVPSTFNATISGKHDAIRSWVDTTNENDQMSNSHVNWAQESVASPVHSTRSDVDSFKDTSFLSENVRNGTNVRPAPIKVRGW